MAEHDTAIPLPLRPQCTICKTEEGLSPCEDCQVVFYCSPDHQTAFRSQHERACTAIKEAKLELDSGLKSNTYLQELRHDHALALLKVKTRTAVEAALDQLLECLRLDIYDSMEVSGRIASILLRLGEDQTCYNFVKWWLQHVNSGYPKWTTSDLSQLYATNADAFEPPEVLEVGFGDFDLTLRSVVILLKIRLIHKLESLDIKALGEASSAMLNKLPKELVDQTRSCVVEQPIATNRALMKDIEDGKDISEHITKLEMQVFIHLFDSMNEEFLPELKEHLLSGRHELTLDENDAYGTHLSLLATYDAWAETPGALKWLRELLG